jgi:hypothetical protein
MSGFPRKFSSLLILSVAVLCSAKAHSQTAAKPSGSISGHVLIGGKGATGIDVAAFTNDVINRRVPAAQVKTDTEGYYHLTGLPAGNYQVATFIANLVLAEPSSDFPYGSFFLMGSSKGVVLASGEEVNDIDIKLVRGGVITGRVTDADNKPMVEERVNIQPVQEPGVRPVRLSPTISQLSLTDDRGIYRIFGLPAGRYRVGVGQNFSGGGGFVGSAGYTPLTYHPDVTDPGRAEIVDLQEGSEATNVDIRVGRRSDTYSISGRIVDSETGVLVPGAPIGLLINPGTQRTYTTSAFGNRSNAEGAFNLSGLMPGHYGVYISTDETTNNNGFYSEPTYFDIVDKDVSGLEIKAAHGLSISGTVVAENMELKDLFKQIPTLRVSANVVQPDGRISASSIRSFGFAMVGADGSFTITGLRPGRALLNVDSTDSSKRPSVVKVSVGGVEVTQGFELEAGQTVSGVQVLVAYGTGSIRGSVTFQGGALSGYRTQITCFRQNGRTYAGSATVDSRGHFVMNSIAPGTYECSAQFLNLSGAPQRPPQVPPQSVTVSNDVQSELNFVIDLTPKPSGGVVNP